MSLFFPIIMISGLMVGVQIENGVVAGSLPHLVDGSAIKYRIDWNLVEFYPGLYDWSKVDSELIWLEKYPLILTIHNAPSWHRKEGTLPCAPLLPESYQEFARFSSIVIERYSPLAVELENEPEQVTTAGENLFGCGWSLGQYSEMIDEVCSQLKIDHPEVKTLAGSLATGKWISGIPVGRCDALSIHVYVKASENGNDWGILQERIDQARKAGHEQIWLTETSLLGAYTPEQEVLQAEWFKFVLKRSGLDGVLWYTIGGNEWMNSDLVKDGIRKPAWYAYAEAAR